MKKVIASLVAASVLVAGAFVVSTIASGEAAAQTEEAPVVADDERRPRPGGVLAEILGDLVDDGTLTQDQADAVTAALVTKRDELKEKFGDRKDRFVKRHRVRAQIREWLQDGVITADELSELPLDLRLFSNDGPLADALEDGEITQAEWDTFIEQRRG